MAQAYTQAQIKALIDEKITTNGTHAIVGGLLNAVLQVMADRLGIGFDLMGIATPGSSGTNPGSSPSTPRVYIAGVGSYPNFANTEVGPGHLGIFVWDGSDWSYNVIDTGAWFEVEEYPADAAVEFTFYDSAHELGQSIKINADISGLGNSKKEAISQWWAAQMFARVNGIQGFTQSLDTLGTSSSVIIPIQAGQVIDRFKSGVTALKFYYGEAQSVTVNASDLPYKAQAELYGVSTVSGSLSNVTFHVRGEYQDYLLNVNDYNAQSAAYADAATARAAVPDGKRLLGLIILYKLSGGWKLERFDGSALSGWGTASNWTDINPLKLTKEVLPAGAAVEFNFEDGDQSETIRINKNVSNAGNEPDEAISQWWAAIAERRMNVIQGWTEEIESLTTSPQTLGLFRYIQTGQIIDAMTGADSLVFDTDDSSQVTVNASALPYKATKNLIAVRSASGTLTDVVFHVQAPNFVSVTQNAETGHTDISVGGVTTPVASVEEVSQLGQEEAEIGFALTIDSGSIIFEGGDISSSNGQNSANSARCRMRDYFDCSGWTSEETFDVANKTTNYRYGLARRYYDSNHNFLGTTWSNSAYYFRGVFVIDLAHGIDLGLIYAINGSTIYSCDKYEKTASQKYANEKIPVANSLLMANLLNNDLSALDLSHRIDYQGKLISNSGYERYVTNKPIYLLPGTYYLKGSAGFSQTPPRISTGGTLLNVTTVDTGVYSFVVPNGQNIYISLYLNGTRTELGGPLLLSVDRDSDRYGYNEISTRFLGLDSIQPKEFSTIFNEVSHNLVNPANVKFDRRYSAGEGKIIAADANKIASSGLIPVKEGEWYTESGEGVAGLHQGGYFGESATGKIGDVAIDNITMVVPVDGVGRCFQVPTGLGIKYVVISLNTNDEHTEVSGNVQLELGEMATDYQAYNPRPVMKEELLPATGGGGGVISSDTLDKYTNLASLDYHGISAKYPNFVRHFLAKDKDLCVVNTGTSLTARSSEHCTLLEDAPYRPPLMHSNNFASHIWDKLAWGGQQYRRYDAKTEKGGNTNYFTENGTGWQTQSNIADWDDGPYRAGFTRYSDNASSAIAFQVPIGARQFNLIYRTDQYGSENCTIAIMEGNGKMQVWNGTAWVEANGYVFSMKESAVSQLPSVTYDNPDTGVATTIFNVQTKGNTTYQKRLKMKAVSVDVAKNISITHTSGRFLYWGVEWSTREYMITYINAARGSHNSLISNDVANYNLIHYQDNEVWEFKPDLLLTEDPIHNSGGGGKPSAGHNSAYFGNVTENFFFADNGVSMSARATTLGLTVPEMIIFNTSLTYNFGAFDQSTGELKVTRLADGLDWTAVDAQMSCFAKVHADHPGVVYINAIRNWVEAAIACYGDLAAATVGSGKDGITFTNEGSHWNDTGCKIMARVVLPVLNLLL